VAPGLVPKGLVPKGLIIVATPIGNAADISARALGVLAGADVVACEDTRVTAKLFAVHGIRVPMLPYHEHNAQTQRPKLMERLKGGETVALVSDAGMPLISDPGYRLVRDCIEAGIALTCVPGPSSVTTALALSGLPTDRFFFQGFLPAKRAARLAALEAVAGVPGSLVMLESANRLADMLADAAQALGEREAAVTRELTKRFEEVRRGPLGELARHYQAAGAPKGEVTVVIGPAPADDAGELDDDAVDAMLRSELETSSLRDAADKVARLSGRPRRQVYARALQLASETS
jgi:16S rRNA (cytidine1402-2'-O)-methyltransferase